MPKRFWVAVDPFDKSLVTAAIEAGAEAVVVPEGKSDDARQLGHITTISADGDWQWGRDVERVRIESESDEEKVHGQVPTVIESAEWTIIPLENLISRTGNLIQTVHDAEEADIAWRSVKNAKQWIRSK